MSARCALCDCCAPAALCAAASREHTCCCCAAFHKPTRLHYASNPAPLPGPTCPVSTPAVPRRACLPGPEVLPRPTYIAADLGRVTLGQALAGSGFDASKQTLFTCEGLVYYLPEVPYRLYCLYCWVHCLYCWIALRCCC